MRAGEVVEFYLQASCFPRSNEEALGKRPPPELEPLTRLALPPPAGGAPATPPVGAAQKREIHASRRMRGGHHARRPSTPFGVLRFASALQVTGDAHGG